MRLYQQAVSKEKRAAQHLAFSALFSTGGAIEPTSTQRGGVKDMDNATNIIFSSVYGGDDGARTRDLCRDRLAVLGFSTTYKPVENA